MMSGALSLSESDANAELCILSLVGTSRVYTICLPSSCLYLPVGSRSQICRCDSRMMSGALSLSESDAIGAIS